MDFAILKLRDADGDGLGPFARQFFDLLQFFAELPGVLDLGDDLLGNVLVAVEEMQQFLAHPVDQVGADFRVAQLVLRLRLEDRVLQPDRDRPHHALPHVVAFELLVAVFVDGLEQPFAEGAQVRAAVRGVLAVDERVKRLAVAAVAVGEAEFQRLLRVMQRRINRLAAVRLQILHHQVQQPVARLERLAVVNQLQPGVQVAVMPQPPLDVLRQKLRPP